MEYLLHIAILASIYSIAAISLDLLAGYTGLVSIAQSAFVGLGAYTSALMSIRLGVPFIFAMLSGMAVAAALSLLVSLPSLRLQEDYFVIATFGFQMVAFGVFNNWTDATQGPFGIPGIPPPTILGWVIDSHIRFLTLSLVMVLLAHSVVAILVTSPFGRVLRAIREDETYAKSMGKNTVRTKVQVFAVSSGLAALGGSLYAHYVTYIDPTSFTITDSVLIISMVALGGAGSLYGPALGATALVILPELLRFVGLPGPISANVRQIIYGLLLVLVIRYRPRGLVGKYRFGR